MRAAPNTPPASGGYRKRPGLEPLPGYRLLEPLGRGGFGEVWKCEAPGGLHKAIKFVADDNDPDDQQGEASLRQEYEAFERVKRIRHPFLLTLERVELVPGDLVMVMELADAQLQDRYNECAAEGLVGIPREELIGHICDAAEVLDFLAAKHGLQHLDIKPANLFVLSGRVKVGDFGLVRQHEITSSTPGADRGLTPKYVAPEILHGRVDPRSDQYCLALVYQEMLTGQFPYPAKSPQQMMLQHVASAPDLTPLPPGDRAAVARALSKAPSDRFGSCTEFVRALLSVSGSAETWFGKSASNPTRLDLTAVKPGSGPPAAPAATRRPGLDPAQLTDRFTRPSGLGTGPVRLTTQIRGGPAPAARPVPVEPVSEVLTLLSAKPTLELVRLPAVYSVMPAERLTRPGRGEMQVPAARAVLDVLVSSVSPDGVVPAVAGGATRRDDGTWRANVAFRPTSGAARLRVNVLRETWDAEVEERSAEHFVARRPHAAGSLWGLRSGKRSGIEVEMRFPPPGVPVGEAVLFGSVYGDSDPALAKAAERIIPQMLEEARRTLQCAEERRTAVRVPTRTPVTLYPVHSDGLVDEPIWATARDVSTSGLRVEAQSRPGTAYVYAVFPEIAPVAQWALLVRLIRTTAEPTCQTLAGRFRVDI